MDRHTDKWKHMDGSTGTCTYEMYSKNYNKKYNKILCEKNREVRVV